MIAPTFHVSPKHPEPRKIAHVVDILEKDGVIFYPTDTVYALGCALDSKKGVEQIRRLKQMKPEQQLALLCAEIGDVAKYGLVTDFAYRTMRKILPGPYTVILSATREVPKLLLDKRRQVGVRVPEHPICEALVRALGRPLLTTSAHAPDADAICLDVAEGKELFPRGIDAWVDGDLTPGQPSTVLAFDDDGAIEIVREGLGPVEGVLA